MACTPRGVFRAINGSKSDSRAAETEPFEHVHEQRRRGLAPNIQRAVSDRERERECKRNEDTRRASWEHAGRSESASNKREHACLAAILAKKVT